MYADHLMQIDEELQALNWRSIDCVALIVAAMHPPYTMMHTMKPVTRKAYRLMEELHYITGLTLEQYYRERKKAVGY